MTKAKKLIAEARTRAKAHTSLVYSLTHYKADVLALCDLAEKRAMVVEAARELVAGYGLDKTSYYVSTTAFLNLFSALAALDKESQ